MYPIHVETFPGATLAVLPHQGCYQEMGPVLARAVTLISDRGMAGQDSAAYSVYFDNPEEVPVNELRSLTGMSIAPDAAVGNELERFEIPACRCAVLTYTGPYDDMDKAYQWLFSEWLPGSNMEPADWAMFEQYLNDPDTTPPEHLQTRIFMPLK